MSEDERKEETSLKKIALIKLEFMQAGTTEIPALLKKYEADERSGVVTICNQYRNRVEARKKELERLETLKQFEKKYADYEYICGIDEVGRGPFAGPVIACAVILPKDCNILYINDSKQLTEKKREELYDEIISQAVAFGIGSVPPLKIDEINILQATYEAMRKAISNMNVKPDILLNDAVTIPGVDIKQVPIIKGDAKSISIAAASIVAKVTRDRLMVAYDKVFPGYDFANNKGYGSPNHIEAIKKLGLTPIHRRSFVKNFI
jgi:ribonuclease HII